MPYDYNDIVRQYYEELKPLFINYLRKRFEIRYDDILDLYVKVWIDVHNNIVNGRVMENTQWKAYILKMGFFQAMKQATLRVNIYDSIDRETFDREAFEKKYTEEQEAEASIYDDPDMRAVLGTELSYIPEPCNKILKLYYYEGLTMGDIAESMNYANSRCAITTKNRCLEKLKTRVREAARILGIMN